MHSAWCRVLDNAATNASASNIVYHAASETNPASIDISLTTVSSGCAND